MKARNRFATLLMGGALATIAAFATAQEPAKDAKATPAPAATPATGPVPVQMKRVDFDPSQKAEPAPANKTEPLQFESKDFNFGKVLEGEHVIAKFAFKNVTDRTITIQSVHASCGCTTPKLDKKEYKPGESGVIEADFDTHGQMGPKTKTVTVTTDDAEVSTYGLKLEGTVMREVFLDNSIIDFGDMQQGTGKKISIALVDTTAQGVKIKETSSSVRGLGISVHEKPEPYTDEVSGRHGQKTIIDLVISPEVEQQNLRGTLTITTDYKANPIFTGSINGRVVGEVIVEPASVYFSIVKPGMPINRSARIRVMNGEEFFMDNFEAVAEEGSKEDIELPKVKVELAPKEGDVASQNVLLTVTPPQMTGPFNGVAVLNGHTPTRKMTVKIPFRMLVSPKGRTPGPEVGTTENAVPPPPMPPGQNLPVPSKPPVEPKKGS